MRSCSQTTERCKALLGTFVRIRVDGFSPDSAHDVLNRCFADVADIHRLMSFQEEGSDISRLNREAHVRPVQVDPRTYEVLQHATAVSEQSDGAFDVTVAPWLVRSRHNAPPRHAVSPDPAAHWSDVQLLPGGQVRFARPLWIDVSGIAKGYAVDRVMALLAGAHATQACVNAGGDLRVRGPLNEQVRLDAQTATATLLPVVQLRNGSLASSGARQAAGAAMHGLYIDGSTQRPAPLRFVSVLATDCVVADALTKVVMARGEGSLRVLRALGARAIMSDGDAWREVA